MLASYTLELLAVLQIMLYFDHHNCAAKVLSYPLHNLAWSTYCGGHRGFVTCSILVQHLHVTFFFNQSWVWESSLMSVLMLLAFPSWQVLAGCICPSLGHAYQVSFIWKLEGRNLVPITTSVSLHASHPEQVNTELKISDGKNTQQNCSSGFWIGLSPYVLTDKMYWPKSCCLFRDGGSSSTTYHSLPSYVVSLS